MEKDPGKVKILAIETSGRMIGVAAAELWPVPSVKGEISFDLGLRHSELLKDTCVFLLERCGWKKEELTHIAVSTGPGSFTGLRVGISFARGLAQAADLPLIGITTFDILAHQARSIWPKSPVCVLIESIGREVFSGIYKSGSSRIQPEVVPVDKIARSVGRKPELCLIGDGYLRYKGEFKSGARTVPQELQFPKAGSLALLAAGRIPSKKAALRSWESVVPFYMRPPLAVERLKNKK